MRCTKCVFLFVIFTAIHASATPASKEPFKIGVMAPLTGDYASAGEEIKRGIELAQETASKRGINVVTTFEDACLPAQGVGALKN